MRLQSMQRELDMKHNTYVPQQDVEASVADRTADLKERLAHTERELRNRDAVRYKVEHAIPVPFVSSVDCSTFGVSSCDNFFAHMPSYMTFLYAPAYVGSSHAAQ